MGQQKELGRAQIYFSKRTLISDIEKKRSTLMSAFLAALKEKNLGKVNLVIDKLYIGANMYTFETLNRLPPYLRPENLATKSNDTAVWFYRSASTFSNHNIKGFEEDGIFFNCSEQSRSIS